MKFKIIIILAALTSFICGKIQAQKPQETIVKEIWNRLKTEDECISKVLAEAEKIDKAKLDSAEHFKSETAMDFDFTILHRMYEIPLDSIAVRYQLQCYKMKDGSWLAVINQYVDNIYVDMFIEYCEGINVIKYKSGKKISYPNFKNIFPYDCLFTMFDAHLVSTKFVFNEKEINCYSRDFWPIKMVWNGKSFFNTSKVIRKTTNFAGDFDYKTFYFNISARIGSKWEDSSDGIFKADKQKIAKFDIKDGIIEGYTLLSPTCGIFGDMDEDGFLKSNPVTIGSPIQYVLELMKDNPDAKITKDDKVVVNLHNYHDSKYKKRDIFLELTAKDEKSPIETIRVYSTPILVTLMGEVDNDSTLSDEVKTIFKAFKFNEKDYGEFQRTSNYWQNNKNGFGIEFNTDTTQQADENSLWTYLKFPDDYDLKVHFQIYNAGDKKLVVLSKTNWSGDNLGDEFWYYENGQFTPAEINLPASDSEINKHLFNEEGLEYYKWENSERYKQDFIWNGNEFVKK